MMLRFVSCTGKPHVRPAGQQLKLGQSLSVRSNMAKSIQLIVVGMI